MITFGAMILLYVSWAESIILLHVNNSMQYDNTWIRIIPTANSEGRLSLRNISRVCFWNPNSSSLFMLDCHRHNVEQAWYKGIKLDSPCAYRKKYGNLETAGSHVFIEAWTTWSLLVDGSMNAFCGRPYVWLAVHWSVSVRIQLINS